MPVWRWCGFNPAAAAPLGRDGGNTVCLRALGVFLLASPRLMGTCAQEAASSLRQSWTPYGAYFTPPRRGARLRDPLKPAHASYAGQSLFSVYVHTPPDFEGYPSTSLFHGREIAPSIKAARFTHQLSVISLLLLEAALYDPQVSNARFVMTSESDIPLYNAAALYLQLIVSSKSYTGRTRTYVPLLKQDMVRVPFLTPYPAPALCCADRRSRQNVASSARCALAVAAQRCCSGPARAVSHRRPNGGTAHSTCVSVQTMSTVSPLTFVEPFRKEHFDKSSQWVALTRGAVYALVHDRLVEPWFRTFGGAHWRCRFIEEASEIIPHLPRAIAAGVNLHASDVIMQLHHQRALPFGFTQGELYHAFVADKGHERRRVLAQRVAQLTANQGGVPAWATGLLRLVLASTHHPWKPAVESLTAEQKGAVAGFRKQLNLRTPAWALVPPTAPLATQTAPVHYNHTASLSKNHVAARRLTSASAAGGALSARAAVQHAEVHSKHTRT
jgi:Core-2/I-Branching enzyme